MEAQKRMIGAGRDGRYYVFPFNYPDGTLSPYMEAVEMVFQSQLPFRCIVRMKNGKHAIMPPSRAAVLEEHTEAVITSTYAEAVRI